MQLLHLIFLSFAFSIASGEKKWWQILLSSKCRRYLGKQLSRCLYLHSDKCEDESPHTRLFYPEPAIIFDTPQDEDLTKLIPSPKIDGDVGITNHKRGYRTAKGACARASLGVIADVRIEIETRASKESSILDLGHIITDNLKSESKKEFNAHFTSGHSVHVGLDWLGIGASGETHASLHTDDFKQGSLSVERARKDFANRLRNEESKTVKISGSARLEGRSTNAAEYCLFYNVDIIEFNDGTELVVINDDPSSGKIADTNGNEVPDQGSKLNFV